MKEKYITDYTGKTWQRNNIPSENKIPKEIKPEWGTLYAEDGHLIYQGFLVGDMACGAGTAFFPDGSVSLEGIFGPKGLICGRVYYGNGQIRFEGSFQYNPGYGPNWPVFGAWYDYDGTLKYYGTFKVIGRGGSVHMPYVLEPEGFGPVPSMHPVHQNVLGGKKEQEYYKSHLKQKRSSQTEPAVAVQEESVSWSQKMNTQSVSQHVTGEDPLNDTVNQKVLKMFRKNRLTDKEGIEFLSEYRTHPNRYLPLVDHQYKHFDEWEEQIIRNMCWGAGLLEGNRPYFMECWKVFLATSITVFISSEGISRADAVRMLERSGLISCVNPEKAKPKIMEFKDSNGNAFYSINSVIGAEEEGQFLFWNGETHPFEELNNLNEKNNG